jgi:ribose/xylose/arabinose/galactoside ABC-type transport system permease subunit
MRSTLRRLLGHGRQLSTLAGLVVLCVLLWILTPFFLTRSNLLNVMEQTALNAIVAVGMTFVIVSGGIDLSVGSIVALSGVVLASALQANWPVPAAIAVGLLVGALTGLLNGLLITRGRLPPFIATLGLMSVARGAALVYTEGRPISGFGAGYRWLATGRVLDVPMPVILSALVYAAAWFVLTRTRFGRYVYAIGGNEEATRPLGRRGALPQDDGVRAVGLHERVGGRAADGAAQLGAADRGHDVRARRDRGRPSSAAPACWAARAASAAR